MPLGSVKLLPGINVERTPTLLEAGYSASQLIRFRDGLAQKYGGWTAYVVGTVSGIPRDLHAWVDLNGNKYLAVGTTTELAVISGGTITDITPQTLTTNPALSITVQSVSNGGITWVAGNVVDAGIGACYTGAFGAAQSVITAGVDAIVFNTPVAIDGFLLSGIFPATYGAFASNGDHKCFPALPVSQNAHVSHAATMLTFTTTTNSTLVKVALTNYTFYAGQTLTFNVSTTGNGVTISGSYPIIQDPLTSPITYFIRASTAATGSGSFTMNSGNVNLTYYLATGYDTSEQTGTKITATDWTQDNWGSILLSCPSNGPVFQWIPGATTTITANPVGSAPTQNGGIFVSNAQQVLICWASSGPSGLNTTFGYTQNLLQVAWSTVGDYTTFIPQATNQAGSFVIPSGATIRGGMAVASQNFIWTDLDLWAMNYIGFPLVYGFNKIGAGSGLISSHAAVQMRGSVYWMGPTNFYVYAGDGVKVIPCSVWDVVFQNLNTTYQANIRVMPNTPFNEVGWLYPSTASQSGECDSYVKFNINEPNNPWDYGTLSRSAWMDGTILGDPISADSSGNIWQQESGNDAGASAMTSSFTTGYFYLAEGEEYVTVTQVIPDMKWGLYGGAQTASVQISFNVLNYPGDAATVYGPYTMTSSTEYISVRFRGRQMSVTVQSSDSGSFWRIGKIRYRYQPDGRR